ncbi:Hypothetical protein SRAE_2000032900 [Strongyloides ratti]|uniref:Uncharacterized protein n=1 Tax=Strongyloides ratti TaxID=34506 RepID=A0A090L7E9_STRRB|nr:Hypothetical protein SRAE_2000032900 [Strongyloides ratti]CEF65652.1 Hypothetical protein SRAE_2000032900 [Strongyloides ratti]
MFMNIKVKYFILFYLISYVLTQQPFYASNRPEGYNFGGGDMPILERNSYPSMNDIDTDAIIRPILSPVERMFELAENNKKMYEYAEKYEEKKKASMFDPDSFLEAIGLKPTTTTKAPTLLEKLFNPFIQPFKRDFEKYAKDSPFKSILPTTPLPNNLINNDSPRQHQPSSVPEVKAYSDLQKLANSFQVDPKFEPLKPLKAFPSIFPLIEKNNNNNNNDNNNLLKSRPIKILEKFFGKDEVEKDIFGFPKPDNIELKNPFTANPLMSMFTTAKPKVSVDDIIEQIPKVLKPVFPTPKPDDLLKFHTLLPITPLYNLLESLGEYAKPQDEIQYGRDKSISILGVPIGKKDGLSLSPTTGFTYEKQNMLGPIAVNDHYNVKWDLFDKFKNVIQDTSASTGFDAMLAKMIYLENKS